MPRYPATVQTALPARSLLTGTARPWVRLALFGAWLIVAGWLGAHHVFWRDEVRAFSLALAGDDVAAMLRRIQGEGHPALWFLVLRGVHGLMATREALPVAAFVIGAGAAGLWAWRAPFRPLVLGIGLFSCFLLYEYTVSARNYGLSALLLFAFAALYPRAKRHGPWLGLILALQCNTNALAVLLAGALSLFWAIELLGGEGWRWTARWRHWMGNMSIAAGGVAACLPTIFPPFNDAAVSPLEGQLTPATLVTAALNVAAPFSALLPEPWLTVPGATVVLAVMLVGATLGLVRSPGGLIAGVLMLLAFPLFFQAVYLGGYRHQALFVAFLLTLYWLVAEGGGGTWPSRRPMLRPAAQQLLQRFGQGAVIALLLAQVALAGEHVAAVIIGVPESRAADLAALIRRERLERAVVIAHPDVLLETVPYYAANPTWLPRERRWGHVVAFTKAAARNVALGELLTTAQALRARTSRPVLILLAVHLDPADPARTWEEGYTGSFSTTPADVRAFLAATDRLARFGPAITDESYDVYRLL